MSDHQHSSHQSPFLIVLIVAGAAMLLSGGLTALAGLLIGNTRFGGQHGLAIAGGTLAVAVVWRIWFNQRPEHPEHHKPMVKPRNFGEWLKVEWDYTREKAKRQLEHMFQAFWHPVLKAINDGIVVWLLGWIAYRPVSMMPAMEFNLGEGRFVTMNQLYLTFIALLALYGLVRLWGDARNAHKALHH